MEFPLAKDTSRFFRIVANPRFILSFLALLNLFSVPQRFNGLCFYNWRNEFYLAFEILVAAVSLLPAKWWSYTGALIISGTVIYDFGYDLLKVFGIIALTPSDPEGFPTPEIWFNVLRQHPEEWLQVALAAAIFICAAIYFVKGCLHQRRLLP
ncbi:MAG TPA: hypothetical protein VEY11_07400 [Pyrinomonadaceae bacterium]|nr:hypothetical protein [Pyrinomonadaceae bacterium]